MSETANLVQRLREGPDLLAFLNGLLREKKVAEGEREAIRWEGAGSVRGETPHSFIYQRPDNCPGAQPRDSTRGVPSDRVCVSCGGPVWWSADAMRLECAACGGTDYRLRDTVTVSHVERSSLEKNPAWEKFGFRGQVANLLWDRGLKQKAVRFANCNRLARPGRCTRYPLEHKYFVTNGCGVIFCSGCAKEQRKALFVAYLEVIRRAVLDFTGELQGYDALCSVLSNKHTEPKIRAENELALRALWSRVGRRLCKEGWMLARIDFTLWSDGSEITPDRAKKMNAAVRSTMRRSVGKPRGFGMLFLDEVGFETRGHTRRERKARGLNLHAHGLYFGPYLDWERTRDLWMRETQKPKDKRNFFLLVSVNGPDPVYMEFDRAILEATGPQAISLLVASRGFWIKKTSGLKTNPEGAIRHALNHMLKYVSKPPAVTPERLGSLIAAFDTAKRVHSLGLFYGKKPEREKRECRCPRCRALGLDSSVSFEGSALPDGGFIPRLVSVEDLRKLGYEPLYGDGRTVNFGDVPLERVERAPP